jgi:hypothetical protein
MPWDTGRGPSDRGSTGLYDALNDAQRLRGDHQRDEQGCSTGRAPPDRGES